MLRLKPCSVAETFASFPQPQTARKIVPDKVAWGSDKGSLTVSHQDLHSPLPRHTSTFIARYENIRAPGILIVTCIKRTWIVTQHAIDLYCLLEIVRDVGL